MKKIQTLSFLATLAIALGMISWGSALHAQDTTPSTTPNSQAQQPSSTPDTAPSQQTPSTTQTPPASTPDSTDRTPSSSQSGSQSQTPDTTTPNSQMPNSNQSPDAGTPANRTPQSEANGSAASGAASDNGSQTFSGTVTKQGDKYVLKDDSGKTYDIDHQDEVKKFDGKRVRVQGTLDPATNKIMVK